jgi:hypothetical protein
MTALSGNPQKRSTKRRLLQMLDSLENLKLDKTNLLHHQMLDYYTIQKS